MSEVYLQMILAVVLGASLGIERQLARKVAGVRTYALVSLGSALFCLMSKYAFPEFWGVNGFDPSRIASQVVVGIGFLGAGSIIFHDSRVHGLTTAAGLWVAAAIGMAVAYKLYSMAIFATALTLVVFVVFWFFENRVVNKAARKDV